MPYTLNKTNGVKLTIVQDGTIDNTSASLTFPGKNYTGYGEVVNENFVALLENFANATQPSKPLAGQQWFNTTTKGLKIYDGTRFKSVGIVENTVNQPITNNLGELWFNPSKQQLYVNNGTKYILVSSSGNAAGTSPVISVTINDSSDNPHTVLEQQISQVPAFITSNDYFNLSSSNDLNIGNNGPFRTIRRGITLSNVNSDGVSVSANPSNTYDYLMWGTAASALGLVQADGSLIRSDAFLKKTDISNITNPLIVTADDGVLVGSARVFKLWAYGTVGRLSNIVSSRAEFDVISAGTLTNVFSMDSSSGLQLLPNPVQPVSLGAAAAGNHFNDIYVNNIRNTATGTIHGNWLLGSGSTLQATYADLAERYGADQEYESGTVLIIGGSAEVTTTIVHADTRVAGIVSTNPAYTLNETAGDNITHPYIALKGRVPCKVIGPISKGDVLVTSQTAGYAECKKPGDDSLASIGRALQDFAGTSGIIEVMVI